MVSMYYLNPRYILKGYVLPCPLSKSGEIERLSVFPKMTQLERGRAGLWTLLDLGVQAYPWCSMAFTFNKRTADGRMWGREEQGSQDTQWGIKICLLDHIKIESFMFKHGDNKSKQYLCNVKCMPDRVVGTLVTSRSPTQGSSASWVPSLSSLDRRGKWVTERASNLPEVTQRGSSSSRREFMLPTPS